MKKYLSLLAAVGCAVAFSEVKPDSLKSSSGGELQIEAPRCEGMRNPLGLQRVKPRFTWALNGAEAQKRPSAAEVKVCDDSGVVWTKLTADLFSCLYDGPALKPGAIYSWQVRLAGGTDWCAPQRFSIGLQTASDWEGAQWIGEGAQSVDWTDITYQTKFVLKKEAFGMLFRARSATEGYMWQINTKLGSEPQLRPHVLRKDGKFKLLGSVKLSRFFPDGMDWTKEHVLRIETRGSNIRTFLDNVQIHDCDDKTFAAGTIGVRTSYGEEATVSELSVKNATGETLLFDRFKGHIVPAFHDPDIADGGLVLKGKTHLHPGILPKTAPRMRKTFALAAKPIREAVVSACGLGFYELWVNGAKADPTRVLAPGMTTGRAALFDTYDVTRLLREGASNTVGIWLAAGYSDDFSRYGWHWRKPKRAILHMSVVYADGTRDVLVTDDSWQLNPKSEIASASIYQGETIDASLRDEMWCTPAAAAEGWQNVKVWPMNDAGKLLSNDEPPVRMSDPRKPVKITETKPGVFVADFGQNRAGVVSVRVKGARGTKIRLHTSELIGADGNIDPWTNVAAKSTDEFILAGTGETETFCPRFTYHGFQYVEITGWPGKPAIDDLTGWAVHADLDETGSFVSDNEMLNKFVNAANWSMRSNFMSYPTDCCMRAERTPCQMDSQCYEDAALQWFEAVRYYEKWLGDIHGGRGNPDWNGDSVTLPWRLYQASGDVRIIAEHYEDMKAQVDADVKKSPNLIWTSGFGDWCAPNDGTWKSYFNDVEIVNSGIFCEMCRIVAESAELLGKKDEASRYRDLHGRAKKAFHDKFFNAETDTYGDGSQTTAVLPLAFDIVPAAKRPNVAARLVKTIRETDKGRVNVGIYGMRYLGDVLCDFDASDLYVSMMTQPEFPGFGFMFANGATTLWEQWTYKSGMNSHNHAMFSGSLYTLMTRLAGIRATKPGYAEIEIRPAFAQKLSHVKAHRDTPRGRVSVEWTRKNGEIVLDLEIPPYTPAVLALPGQANRTISSGRHHVVVSD